MTREEAIILIGAMKGDLSDFYDDNDLTALDMAISALQKNESAEEWYKLFCEKWDEGDYVCNIPKGMTNGEVVQTVFPNIELGEKLYNIRRFFLMHQPIEAFDFKTTDRWWNAPYQKGGE